MESVIGVNAVRITRLLSDGTPDYGNVVGGFLLCGGVSKFAHDFAIDAGPSIFLRDAAGNACVNRKRPDDVKYTTFTLTMCRDDPRLSEIILHGGATLLTDVSNYPIGRGIKASANCGVVSTPTGVMIELWSELEDCDHAAALPYQHVVLPRCFLTPKGFTRDNNVSLPEYIGYCQTNPKIDQDGPYSDWSVDGTLTNLIYFDFGEDDLPDCVVPLNYIPIPAS